MMSNCCAFHPGLVAARRTPVSGTHLCRQCLWRYVEIGLAVERRAISEAMTNRDYKPPHGGYPTPRYEQVSLQRRITSQRIYGHPGAHVSYDVNRKLAAAGEGRAV